LGLPEQAAELQSAITVATVLGFRTPDVGGISTTEQVTNAIINALQPSPRV
jgi:isocitrate/isopropylmalate dehydrogenase